MNKVMYKLVSAIVLFALTFGSFYNVGASSQLAVTTYYVAMTGNSGTAPSVAAATSTAQSTSETVYDEKDSRFVYSADWTSYSYAGSYGGSYKMTFKNNSFATLTFSG